jgi:uncharacterized coiled-coil protein SlyX
VLPVLGFLGSKITRYLVGGAVLLLACVAIYSYFSVTQGRIDKLTRERDQLELQVDQYKKAVTELQLNFDKYRAALDELMETMIAAGIPEKRIIEFFKQNDFSKMTPEQIQELINKQQVDIRRCYEVLSGKKDKEPNPLCPDF